ncbi:MAG TPA: tetratricopeptide repeat protein [Sphingomicrobium sp.]|nr:tetratricopeptide repeat protein [Sphingomicrobium sp.]
MKAFLAPAALALITAAPATAAVWTVSGSLARSCYVAAEARIGTIQALEHCEQAFRHQALSGEERVATHVNRGIVRMVRRDFAGARADFEAAAALEPREPEAWLNLGVLLFNEGNSADAVPMFDRAIELRTKRPAFAYFGRGVAHEDLGNVRAAYADLSRARSLMPGWALPAAHLARYQVRGN